MSIVASFLDPGDNGWDVGDAAQQLGFLLLVGAVLWGLFRWFLLPQIRTIVVEEVTKATAPIQKEANGGYSLPDVARAADWNKRALLAIGAAHGIDLPDDDTAPGNYPNDRKA